MRFRDVNDEEDPDFLSHYDDWGDGGDRDLSNSDNESREGNEEVNVYEEMDDDLSVVDLGELEDTVEVNNLKTIDNDQLNTSPKSSLRKRSSIPRGDKGAKDDISEDKLKFNIDEDFDIFATYNNTPSRKYSPIKTSTKMFINKNSKEGINTILSITKPKDITLSPKSKPFKTINKNEPLILTSACESPKYN